MFITQNDRNWVYPCIFGDTILRRLYTYKQFFHKLINETTIPVIHSFIIIIIHILLISYITFFTKKKKKIYRLQEKQLYWKLTLTFHHIYLNLFDSGDHTFKVSSGKFDFVMLSPLWTLTDMTPFPYFEVQISSNTFFSSLFSSEFLQRLLTWFSEYI